MDRKREDSALNRDRKMNAVDQADAIFREYKMEPGEKLYEWFERIAFLFPVVTPRTVRKIYSKEKKKMDADQMDRIRKIHEERLTRLKALKEQNDENQRRINELIYLRHEGRHRPLA